MKNKIILLSVLMLFGFSVRCSAASFSKGESVIFDFGAEPSENTVQVSASAKYTSGRGYGFDSVSFVKNVTASGSGVCSDGVMFLEKNGHSSKFMADVPPGIYNIKITAGNIDTMNITAEGYYAVMNMTYNNCEAQTEIPVEDGTLDIEVSSWKQGTVCSLSALEITRVSDIDERRTRVFIGGDSLAAAYYPLDIPQPFETGYQGGWGQMISKCIPEDLYVMNYASGGQTAEGFLNSGQFSAVEHYMQEGDYFIIAFGINDSMTSDEETFGNTLREMVVRTKQKGGIPIIMVSPGLFSDFDKSGICYTDGRWFKDTARSVCEELNCNYVDMHNIASAYYTEIGMENTQKLYWTDWGGNQDMLHTSREGAGQLARLITEELVRQGIWRFDGVVANYGVSGDVRVKCSGVYSKNKITFQNTMPSGQNVKILVNTYNDGGVLTGTDVQSVYLPPYDPLAPSETVSVTLDAADNGCKAYLVNGSRIISLNDTPENRNFSTVYDKAAELFDERI